KSRKVSESDSYESSRHTAYQDRLVLQDSTHRGHERGTEDTGHACNDGCISINFEKKATKKMQQYTNEHDEGAENKVPGFHCHEFVDVGQRANRHTED